MLIDQYYNQSGNTFTFTRDQASHFAKDIADDFNPLHDVDAKRFCVPGDLLFSLMLAKLGVNEHMAFTFSGMVNDDVVLLFPEASDSLSICDESGKQYLSISRRGENHQNSELIDNLTRSYVTFSGHTFPHILIPLLEQHQVMINPERPMVIYESMIINLKRFDLTDVELVLNKEQTTLETQGKRGKVRLSFTLIANGEIIGDGEKHMVLSGLKPYEKAVVDNLVDGYKQWKNDYKK